MRHIILNKINRSNLAFKFFLIKTFKKIPALVLKNIRLYYYNFWNLGFDEFHTLLLTAVNLLLTVPWGSEDERSENLSQQGRRPYSLPLAIFPFSISASSKSGLHHHSLFLYQSTVSLSQLSKSCIGFHPSSFLILLLSRAYLKSCPGRSATNSILLLSISSKAQILRATSIFACS